MVQSQDISMLKEPTEAAYGQETLHLEVVCNACSLKHKESKDDYDASVFSTHSKNLLPQVRLLTLLRIFVMMLLEVMMLLCLSLEVCLNNVFE